MNETIIVFDTETINVKDLDVFDLGYVVKKNGKILESGSFLIKEVFGTPLYEKAYYFEMNNEKYADKIRNKEIEIVTLAEARECFNRAIVYHKVDLIAAFIIDFDLRALSYSFSKYIKPVTINVESLYKNNRNVLDVSLLFAAYYGLRDDYKDFCKKNGYMTDKGNYKTTAEVIYRFIKGNTEHNEEHTAYQDSLEEAEILEFVLDKIKKEGKQYLYDKAIEATLNSKKAYTFFK